MKNQEVKYKVISGFGTDRFTKELNDQVKDGWKIHGDLNTINTSQGSKFSILLFK